MKTSTIQLEQLTCPSCLLKIEAALKKINGVDKDSVKVMFNSSRVRLNFDDTKTAIKDIENAIINVGFEVLNSRVKDL